jgi:hypothetical protein
LKFRELLQNQMQRKVLPVPSYFINLQLFHHPERISADLDFLCVVNPLA